MHEVQMVARTYNLCNLVKPQCAFKWPVAAFLGYLSSSYHFEGLFTSVIGPAQWSLSSESHLVD